MISIIVPVYNVERYLPQCLDSLIGQTYRDLEIICVNDGSTDGSLRVLEKYAENDKRVKVTSRENRGLSESRNDGIEIAQGEWLMFVDSDDWLETDCCERLMERAVGRDMVFFSYVREFTTTSSPKYIFDESPKSYDAQNIETLYERLIAPNEKELSTPAKLDSLSTAWGKLYRTSVIRDNGTFFTSTKIAGTEDLVFNGKLFNHIRSAYYLPDCLYHYRKSKSGSLSYSHRPDLCKQWLYVFDEIEKSSDAMRHPWMAAAIERRKALCLFGLGLNITFSQKSWKEERLMLSDILNSNWYTAAIAHLDTSPMPLHWRLFYGMARRRQTWAVLLMVKAINIIINR